MKVTFFALFVALLMAGCGVNPSYIAVHPALWPVLKGLEEGKSSRPSAFNKIRKAKREKSKSLELEQYGITNLKPLAELTKLESLTLRRNIITDLTPLAGLTKLESLTLRHNKITDIAPLAGLTNLRYLDLGQTKITDVSPLAELTELTELHLDRCPLTEGGQTSRGITLYRHDNPYWDLQSLMEYTGQIMMIKKALPNCRIHGLPKGWPEKRRPGKLHGEISGGIPIDSWTGLYDGRRKKIKVRFAQEGKIASAQVWKPNGEKCPVTNLKDGNGIIVIYNDDGTEKVRFTFKDGKLVRD